MLLPLPRHSAPQRRREVRWDVLPLPPPSCLSLPARRHSQSHLWFSCSHWCQTEQRVAGVVEKCKEKEDKLLLELRGVEVAAAEQEDKRARAVREKQAAEAALSRLTAAVAAEQNELREKVTVANAQVGLFLFLIWFAFCFCLPTVIYRSETQVNSNLFPSPRYSG